MAPVFILGDPRLFHHLRQDTFDPSVPVVYEDRDLFDRNIIWFAS